MDWIRFRGALIRFAWSVIFPAVGALVAYLLGDGVLEDIGVTDPQFAVVIGAILYGLKRLFWPDTVI